MLRFYLFFIAVLFVFTNCNRSKPDSGKQVHEKQTASKILGNPDYMAMSYGAYRTETRDVQPTVQQIKNDLEILHAHGIRFIRTYNVQFAHASNVLKAITELKQNEPDFEMYVMLGAWIDCKNAWSDLEPDHKQESPNNESEIKRAVELANKYPDIVKVIAVGNEAMVRWAESYYVQPRVILKWVKHLQNLKKEQKLNKDVWITSSDNFAAWGGEKSYQNSDLKALVKAVDYVSVHTYPMHDTHYNPEFWGVPADVKDKSKEHQITAAMDATLYYAQKQYKLVQNYVNSIDSTKAIHIGETGWATKSKGFYGTEGSKATDEYKQALYYQLIRKWTNANNISCFFFEAFDEKWKDPTDPLGSENHFGLFTVHGQAKYALWEEVDQGVFKGLKRDSLEVGKTFNGNTETLLQTVETPAVIKSKKKPTP